MPCRELILRYLSRKFLFQHLLQPFGYHWTTLLPQQGRVIQLSLFSSSSAPIRAACMAPAIPQPPLMEWPIRRTSWLFPPRRPLPARETLFRSRYTAAYISRTVASGIS